MIGRRAKGPPPRAPEGWVLYAIGDVHGRADLFETLLDRIDADLARLPPGGKAALILLGDYVDRGPQSREVLDLASSLEGSDGFAVHALKGNHEEAMIDFFRSPREGPVWGEFGGPRHPGQLRGRPASGPRRPRGVVAGP